MRVQVAFLFDPRRLSDRIHRMDPFLVCWELHPGERCRRRRQAPGGCDLSGNVSLELMKTQGTWRDQGPTLRQKKTGPLPCVMDLHVT